MGSRRIGPFYNELENHRQRMHSIASILYADRTRSRDTEAKREPCAEESERKREFFFSKNATTKRSIDRKTGRKIDLFSPEGGKDVAE